MFYAEFQIFAEMLKFVSTLDPLTSIFLYLNGTDYVLSGTELCGDWINKLLFQGIAKDYLVKNKMSISF